jgi:tRNA pseudouridine13 synthase
MTPEPNQAPDRPLPFITPELPGIGGVIKLRPEHFRVEELPLYLPVGQGEHLYLVLEREGWNTRDLAKRLAAVFAVAEDAVGHAGLKDKQAWVRQTFSVQVQGLEPEAARARAAAALGRLDPPVSVVSAARHGNKLKAGHLLGNRFQVVVSQLGDQAEARAQAVAHALQHRGLANYFGPQRFGRQGDNPAQGRAILAGRGPREKWLRKLLLSAWQSEVFNQWLARRVEDGDFARLLPGDLAKKTDTGGLFIVEDLEAETPRMERREITYTGPLMGAKLRWAEAEAGRRERAALEAAGVDEVQLKKAGLQGGRRPARIWPQGLSIAPHPEGLVFAFLLPKGAYATTLLREFCKLEPATPESQA